MKKIILITITLFSLLISGCPDTFTTDDLFTEQETTNNSPTSGDYGTVNPEVINSVEPTVSYGNQNNGVLITWEGLSADKCVIYRKDAQWKRAASSWITATEENMETPWTILTELDSTENSYLDTSAIPGALYYYCIKGIILEPASEGYVSYGYPGFCFGPPETISAAIRESKNYIGIRWNYAPSSAYYKIFRAEPDSIEFIEVGTSIVNCFDDSINSATPIQSGKLYQYKISSVKSDDMESGFSDIARGELLSPYAVEPPALVTARRALDINGITVNWDEVPGAAGYVVGRQLTPTSLIELLNNGEKIDQTQWIDNTIDPGTHYIFSVMSVNSAGQLGTWSSLNQVNTDSSPDNDGCVYSSEGYSLVSPVVHGAVTCSNYTDTRVFVLISNSEGADGYNIYRKDSSSDAFTLLTETELFIGQVWSELDPSLPESLYAVTAINEEEGLTIETPISEGILVTHAMPSSLQATNGLFEKQPDGLIKGKIDLSWKSITNMPYQIEKKDATQQNYEVIAQLNGINTYTDTDFDLLTFEFFNENIADLEPQTGETDNDALARLFTSHYRVTAIPAVGYSAQSEISGWRMITYLESFFLLQLGEDTATNKLTNQNDYSGLYPDEDEDDPGFRSGMILFHATLDIGTRSAEVKFTFNNYSDWPGLIMNGSYMSLQYDGPNMSNRQGTIHTDTTSADGLFKILRKCDLRLATNNSVYSGSVTMTISGVGAYKFSFNTPEEGIYVLYSGTKRCPGGRNAMIGDRKASGHYNWYDGSSSSPLTASKQAYFEGNNLGILINP